MSYTEGSVDFRLLQRLMADQDLSVVSPDWLRLVEQRPLPTRRDRWILTLVRLSCFTTERDTPLSPRQLAFLKRHLSLPVFADLVRGLFTFATAGVSGRPEPLVTLRHVQRLLRRQADLARLRREIAEQEGRAAQARALLATQQAAARPGGTPAA